jgi:hypothetical protein
VSNADEQNAAEAEAERRAFIRQHASRLARVTIQRGGVDCAPYMETAWSEKDCWDAARRLWEAKPDDC